MTMLRDPSAKYSAFPQVPLENREWPSRVTTKAPIWLSTDLRDGNQSLIDPMDAEKKTRFFDLLVKSGFKEIEVGFPASGATDFDYIQNLVRSGRIPDCKAVSSMPAILCVGSHRSAASSDTPASGPSPRT